MASSKMWGPSEFWGISADYDPDWVLTESQKELQKKLIELCRVKIRPHAIHCDKVYAFPRQSLNALAELGILGLIVPKEYGGLGENHVCCAMVAETIARYGCPSTAMVFTMHVSACATILFRYHNNDRIKDLLPRINKEKLVGTLSYSDPATGGHFWFPLSSKIKCLDENTIKMLKYGSWATSSGHADWYGVQTISPNFNGDYSDLSVFLIYKDEVRASTDDWKALGMHGNMSGPLIIEGTFSLDRMIGPPGDGAKSNDECVDIFFLLSSSAVWNGISMGCIDIAKKHVTRKAHADVGMRVCDYPTIQDYFGDTVTDANASRALTFLTAKQLDDATNNNDWKAHEDISILPRAEYLHWTWQMKLFAARVVNNVSDVMMHSCGGSGYKNEMGLERILRDGKAGWVMGPSNEVLRQFVGKTTLMGLNAVDYWDQRANERTLTHEINKMDIKSKKVLALKLLNEVETEEKGTNINHPYQDTDFDNPFNTCQPIIAKSYKIKDKTHNAALNPTTWTTLKLRSRSVMSDVMGSFVFDLPNPSDHTGCLPGQYVQVKVVVNGKEHTRFFSPVSRPDDFGRIELVMRYETQGILSQHFKTLKQGDKVDFIGPCGGFEYIPNKLDELTLLASGGGITPGLQLIRCIMNNPSDKTSVNLIYFSDNYQDILYREELDKYAASDKRLRIVHTLGEVPENWNGEEGFIDTDMIDKHVSKSKDIKHKIVMCGGPTMTISCLHSLKSLGFSSDSTFIYGQFGVEQVRIVYGRNSKLCNHTC